MRSTSGPILANEPAAAGDGGLGRPCCQGGVGRNLELEAQAAVELRVRAAVAQVLVEHVVEREAADERIALPAAVGDVAAGDPGLSRCRSAPMPRAASMRGSADSASVSAISVKGTKRRPADISTRTPTTPRTFERQHQQRSVIVRTRALVSQAAPSRCVVSGVASRRHRAMGPPQPSIPTASAGGPAILSALETFHRWIGQSSTKPPAERSKADTFARLEHHEPLGDPGRRERRTQLVRALREVRPALEVHGDDGAGAEDLGRLRGGVGREREVGPVEAVGRLTPPQKRTASSIGPSARRSCARRRPRRCRR